MLELEADHRRHAEVENAIRDLKYGVGLNHMPSGRFAANGAWLAVQVIALPFPLLLPFLLNMVVSPSRGVVSCSEWSMGGFPLWEAVCGRSPS